MIPVFNVQGVNNGHYNLLKKNKSVTTNCDSNDENDNTK